MKIDEIKNDPKFQALSPEAKKIVLEKSDPNFEKLSTEAKNVVISKITTTEEGNALDRFVMKTPGLRQAAQVADYLGFGKMAEGVKNIPGAIARTPQAFMEMVRQAKENPRSLIPTGRDVVNAAPLALGLAAVPVLGPGAGIASRVAASALGSGAGDAIKSVGEGQPAGETIKNVIQGTVAGGVGEAGGDVATKLMTKSAAPFAGKMTDEAKQAAETATKEGLPLSPSAINPTKTAKAFEWVSDKLLPGKWWVGKKKEQLATKIQGLYDEAVENIPIKSDRTQAGVTLRTALDKETHYGKYLDELNKVAKEGGETLGGEPAIVMDNTSQVISDLQNKSFGEGGNKLHSMFAGFSREGSVWTPETVKRYSSTINNTLKSFAKGKPLKSVPVSEFVKEGDNVLVKPTTQTLEDVKTAMLDALKEDIKGAWPSLQKAQEFYKVFGPSSLKKSPFLQNIVKTSKNRPDVVVNDIFKSKDFDNIDILKTEITKVDTHAWDIVKNRFVENVFDSSIIQTADEAGQMFSPAKFARNFDKNADVLKRYAPDSYENMKKLANISRVAMKDLGRKSPDLMDIGLSSGLSGAGAAGGVLGISVPNTFSFIMAKSMMNPKGWVKKWLTTGFGESTLAGPLAKTMAIGNLPSLNLEKEND